MVNYAYNAWGELISTTGTLASTIGVVNKLRYRSYYYDDETGFYYLQSRYYDPVVKRFISPDSTDYLTANGTFDGFNLYAYCANNPVNGLDSGGTDAVLLFKNAGRNLFGHCGLLVESTAFRWFYFSVSGKETNNKMKIDFVYVGTALPSISASKLNDFINKKYDSSGFKSGVRANYRTAFHISGNFFASYLYCYRLYLRPETYSAITNNCLHKVATALYKGKFSSNYYRAAVLALTSMTIPVNAEFAFSYFVSTYQRYYSSSLLYKLFVRDPYYYFYNPIK